MLHNLDTIYDIARSSNTFSTEINFSENIFLVYRGGRAPLSMPGTAAPATVPTSGGVDDADDAPMTIGGRWWQGWGERRRRRRSSRRSVGTAGNDGATAAAATTVA